MAAIKEKWDYGENKSVWVGKYFNSRNDLHYHDDYELVYVESGEVQVLLDGVTYRLTGGNAMFIDSRLLHMLVCVDPATLLQIVVFERHIAARFAKDLELVSPLITDGDRVRAAYVELLSELKAKRPMYAFMAESIVNRLLIELFRAYPTRPKKAPTEVNETLKKLLSDIKANYEWYTLDDAAKFMGMNANYFSQFFRKKTGVHFTHFMNCVRTEMAVELLLAGENTVAEIAVRCGFGTIRSFNSVFKKITGYAPTKLPENYVFAVRTDDDPSHPKPLLKDSALIESA